MHVRRAQHAKALRAPLEAAHAQVDGTQLEVQRHASRRVAVRRKLAEVAGEDRLKLTLQMPPRGDKAVGPGGHVKGQGLDVCAGRAIGGHHAGIGRKAGREAHGLAHVEVIRVAFAAHAGIRRKQHLGLHAAHGLRDAAQERLRLIKAAVGQRQKPHVAHAQHRGAAQGFLAAQLSQRFARNLGKVGTETAVRANQKHDVLAGGGQAGNRRSRADFDIVRVRPHKEIALKRFQARKRRGPAPAPAAEPAAEEGIFLRLEVLRGDYIGGTTEFTLVRELVIGREEDCGIPFADASVSRRNSRVFLAGGAVYIEDLSSQNGTCVNGERISMARQLRSGDEISAGDVSFRLKF